MPVEVTNEQLLRIILQVDDELLHDGIAPPQRTVHIIPKVMEKLGFQNFVFLGTGAPDISRRIGSIHQSLYRQQDIATGGIHGGIFMFRDVFVRIDVPIIYGRVAIDPLALAQFNPMQARWIRDRPDDFKMFIDQFIDIFDFAGGIATMASYKRPPANVMDIIWLATFQFQAAAATLSAAFNARGAIQSSLIGAELALKSGLAFAGVGESGRRAHGHDLFSAAMEFSESNSGFDIDRVRSTIKRLPPYVANRYSTTQPDRKETGHIAMGAQYIAGEVMRQITGYSVRSALAAFPDRTYPKL
jgi:hypothetical protein